jgi:type VI secretion system secreted protein Hcp
MTYFLQLDGIAGEATDRGHEGWFTAEDLRWSMTQAAQGRGGGAGAGRADLQPVVVTGFAETNWPLLLVAAASGRHVATAAIEHVADGERPMARLRLDLTDVPISALAIDGADGAPVRQTLSLGYGTITATTFGQDARGSAVTGATGGWDLRRNAPL